MVNNTLASAGILVADQLRDIEILTLHLKKDIILSKDVNLACLLINNYTANKEMRPLVVEEDTTIFVRPASDHRLNSFLTIQEFVRAFLSELVASQQAEIITLRFALWLPSMAAVLKIPGGGPVISN